MESPAKVLSLSCAKDPFDRLKNPTELFSEK
jgi:hypothetical protein